jgi:hypothetical protein
LGDETEESAVGGTDGMTGGQNDDELSICVARGLAGLLAR